MYSQQRTTAMYQQRDEATNKEEASYYEEQDSDAQRDEPPQLHSENEDLYDGQQNHPDWSENTGTMDHRESAQVAYAEEVCCHANRAPPLEDTLFDTAETYSYGQSFPCEQPKNEVIVNSHHPQFYENREKPIENEVETHPLLLAPNDHENETSLEVREFQNVTETLKEWNDQSVNSNQTLQKTTMDLEFGSSNLRDDQPVINPRDTKNIISAKKNEYSRSDEKGGWNLNGPTKTQKKQVKPSGPRANRQPSALVRNQILVNETMGRLFADIDGVFSRLRENTDDEYHRYRLHDNSLPLDMLLDNIACYLDNLVITCQSSGKEIVVPRDDTKLWRWKQGLTNLYHSFFGHPDLPKPPMLLIQILQHAVDCIEEGKIESLPEDWVDDIFGQDFGQQAASHLVNHDQSRVLAINTRAQDIANDLNGRLALFADYSHREITFSTTPLLGCKAAALERR